MDLKEMLEKVIREKDGLIGLTIEKVTESPCSKPGDNYMSVVSGVEVQGVLADGKPYSKQLFMKRPVDSQGFRETFHISDAFHNEATTYLKMFPLYDVTMPCPRCYHADCDVIILEDLRSEGYTMGERCKGFDLKNSRHALKAIAMFHAASYYAMATKKEEFTKVVRLLKVVGLDTSAYHLMLEGLLPRIQTLIAEEPEFKTFLDYIKPLEGKVQKTIMELRKANTIEIVCHGDFWINNILVRPGEHDSVRLVDLQASDITSPAVDIWTFLYTSLELSVMNDHADQLLQLYCESFVDELTSLKLPHKQIPSQKEVVDDLNSREFYGFLIAVLYLPLLSVDSEPLIHIDTLSEEDIAKDTFMTSVQFTRMRERLIKLISISTKRGVFTKPL